MQANLRQKLGKSIMNGSANTVATRAKASQGAVVNYTQQSKII